MSPELQTVLTVSVPTLAVLIGILVNYSRLSDLSTLLSARIDDLRTHVDQRLDDFRELMEARLGHLEDRIASLEDRLR